MSANVEPRQGTRVGARPPRAAARPRRRRGAGQPARRRLRGAWPGRALRLDRHADRPGVRGVHRSADQRGRRPSRRRPVRADVSGATRAIGAPGRDAARRAAGGDQPPPRRRAGRPGLGPARRLRVRAGRPAEGAGDPARRGPAVRLDRARDRAAGRGAGGRIGAEQEPDPAADPLPPRRPQRRHRSASTRSARPRSRRCWRRRGSTWRG